MGGESKKVYLQQDTLHLLINKDRGITRVLSLDLQHKKVTDRSIVHNESPVLKRGKLYADNTFLLNNKLYYAGATADSFCLQVLDFTNGLVLQTYRVGRNDSITFKNTPIMQESNSFTTNSDQRSLKKTRQLLRKMANHSAAIIATLNQQQQVEVAVGSYQRHRRTVGGGFIPMAGGSFIYTAFSVNDGRADAARFKMLVNPVTGQQEPGQIRTSVNEQIQQYAKAVNISPDAENLVKLNSSYYYSYYDKKQRTLSLLPF